MHFTRRHHVTITLVLASLLALGACGKSESETASKTAPLTGAGGEATGAKAGAAPAANKGGDKAIATASKADPTRVLAVNRLDLPDDIVAVVAIKSLDGVLAAAKAALELLDPSAAQPGFISATKEGIKESLGWKDISWLAGDKPIRSILFNAKQYMGKAQFLAFPMTNKDAVLAALPEGAKQKDGDHAAMYENNGQTVYVDFVADHAIYSDHPSFFAKGKELFTQTISKWEPSRDVEIKLDLDNIYTLFLPEIAQAKQQIIASYSSADSATGIAGVDQLVALQVEGL
ncbi:MAG: hypothetical protein QF464_16815, partial [Myxococcota bacterium]|nr:hypothetical protein [Myxococcota bacterium]